uniref:Thioredoxin domain containing 11 n=1 Tax=Astyanax mexicanus TaxID=7994 RepID=W5KYF0_ASTMX
MVRGRMAAVMCGALLLGLALLLALTLTCSRAKNVVAVAPTPVRFFSPQFPVVDLFLGQQDQVDRLREEADVCVLVYYAPWCAHSINTRDHIQQVALRMANEVRFVGVNCWWNQGKCRKQKSFFKYPVIQLFYRRFGPIEYRGPLVGEYIESFIRKVVSPLTYLPTRSALNTFISHHEQGVVGFFEFNSSPQPPGYVTFLTSALHALRRDSQKAVRFGVVTNQEVAEGVSLREDESVYLHRRFNTSLVFPREERNFTAEAICNWVYENRESVVHWIQPTGAKSYSLEAELHKGPALLTFLPHNPLTANHQLLSEVVDVALRYRSCCLSELQFDGGIPSALLTPSGSPLPGPRCCQSLLLSGSRSESNANSNSNSSASICELCVNRSAPGSTSCSPLLRSRCSVMELEAVLDSYLRNIVVPVPSTCTNLRNTYSPFSHYSACCRTLPQDPETPARSDPHCPLVVDSVTGLHCRTNKTLRFYLLDSHLSWPLAQRLGALGNQSTRTFTTIVNLRDETHYVLENADKNSLEHFILNFSAPYSPLHRHLVGHRELHPPQSLIQEVTTHSFIDTVMDPERDVLVFYYSGWCGFCTVLNHVLLRLARLFQGNSALTVARINVGLNDLPWEFMVDHLPSFLFFPKHRKQMSVKFPDSAPVTLPNLVRFILQHTGHAPQAPGAGPASLLEAELRSLQGEVLALQQAREQLSRQLAALWRENRRLAFHARALTSYHAQLQSHNAELQEQSGRLETLYREKSRQLADAVGRLQELADASEELLAENSLLKVLLTVLREREGEEPERTRKTQGKEASS